MKTIFFCAQTLNAKIAHNASEFVDWTSAEDKKYFREETRKCGVVVMGNATYKTMERPMPGRLNVVMTRSPDASKNQEGALEFTDKPLLQILQDLEKRGFPSVAVIGGAQIFTQFLESGLCDELAITIEPKIFGSGINIFNDFTRDVSLKLLEVRKLNEDAVLLRYKIVS
ncbi:MAG: dihydrofolate reductase family protein [Patescibacteria group bacterium]